MYTGHNIYQWESSAVTHPGNVRKVNQDACLSRPEIGLWLVADGMGGHSFGELASQSIVSTLRQAQFSSRLSDNVKLVEDNLQAINRHLLIESARQGDDTVIGSTVVVLIAYRDISVLLWAGDSRAYRMRDGQLLQLTQDHSQVEEMVKRGLILREDAESHPLANIVTRAVGASDTLNIELINDIIQEGDIFLLCSDGLNKELKDSEISQVLTQDKPAAQLCSTLLDLTLAKKARDNVTAVVIKTVKVTG